MMALSDEIHSFTHYMILNQYMFFITFI